jgi:maltose alpha-D-glucosyltransferase/alpha-amylase
VLAIRYDWRDTSLLTLHNFSDSDVKVQLNVGCSRDDILVELFDGRHSRVRNDGTHRITLQPYAWRWYRVGSADNTLDRRDLNVTDHHIR